MKATLAAFFLSLGCAGAVVEPPMPAWDVEVRSQMLEDGWIAGRSLLTFESLFGEQVAAETPIDVVGAVPADLATDEAGENVVSEEYLTEYFSARPKRFLLDPQDLLGTRERLDLEAFLEHHAGDSSIDMVVYVFGADQEIPGEVREEEVVERLYSVGKPAVIVYYYLGAPQRSTIYLSPIITDAVSAAEQRRALESSVIRAFDHADPGEQLQAFLVQMSIRIYWMERMAEGTAIETMEVIPEDRAAYTFTEKKELKEVPEEPLPSWVKITASVAVAVAGLLLLGWSAFMWFRARARYVFPEFEVEPRLGASHAAGIGAVISFSSSAIPPAHQRDQVPDYMRRA